MRTTKDVKVTQIITAHLDQVLEIEYLTAASQPKGREVFAMHVNNAGRWFGRVAVLPGSEERELEVLGFILYVYGTAGCCIEVVAVHPATQRRGIGSLLLDTVKNTCKECAKPRTIYTLTATSDYEARAFFVANGFNGGGVLQDDPDQRCCYECLEY